MDTGTLYNNKMNCDGMHNSKQMSMQTQIKCDDDDLLNEIGQMPLLIIFVYKYFHSKFLNKNISAEE